MGCCSSARATVVGVALLHLIGSLGCIGLWSYLITLDGESLNKGATESWKLLTTLHLPVVMDADGNQVSNHGDEISYNGSSFGDENSEFNRYSIVVNDSDYYVSPEYKTSMLNEEYNNEYSTTMYAEYGSESSSASPLVQYPTESLENETEPSSPDLLETLENTSDSSSASPLVEYSTESVETDELIPITTLNPIEESATTTVDTTDASNDLVETEETSVMYVDVSDYTVTELTSTDAIAMEVSTDLDQDFQQRSNNSSENQDESEISLNTENVSVSDITTSDYYHSSRDDVLSSGELKVNETEEGTTLNYEDNEHIANETSANRTARSAHDAIASVDSEIEENDYEEIPTPLPVLMGNEVSSNLLENNATLNASESNSTEEDVSGSEDTLGVTIPSIVTTTGFISTIITQDLGDSDSDSEIHTLMKHLSLSAIVMGLLFFSSVCGVTALVMMVGGIMRERYLLVPWIVVQWITVLLSIAGVGILTWQLVLSEVLLWCWWLLVITLAGVIVLILCLVIVMEAYQTITIDITNDNAYSSYELEYMTGKTRF